MIEAELNQATAGPAPQAAATNPTPASAPGPSAQTSTADPKSDPDYGACEKASGDSSITACDRAIASGKFGGTDLGALYRYRAFAKSHAEKPDLDAALADYGEAVRLEPNSFVPFILRANVYAGKGEQELAIKDYDRAIERSMGTNQAADCDRAIASGKFEGPALAALYNNRGQARGLNNDDDGALEDFNKSIELYPNADAPYNNRGTIYADRKEFDRAIADFDKAIELNATQPFLYKGRGLAYWKKGDLEHAAADYKKALSLNPPPMLKEKIEQELKEIEAGGKSTPGSEPAQKQGSAVKAQLPTSGPWAAIAADGNGRWGHAVGQPSQDVARNAALKGCGGSGCKILDALQARCIAYAESREGGYWYFGFLGPNESAVQNNALNACNKAAPAGSCKLLKSICGPGSASQTSTDPKKDADYCMTTIGPDAMPACDRAIASGHFGTLDLGTLHNQRGVLHFMNRKDDDAIAEFSEAIRLDGSLAKYFNHRGNAYIAKGDFDKAIADFDHAIKLAPESSSGYQGRALAYLKKGITGLARDDYNKALSLNPDADNRKEIEEALKDLGPDFRTMKAQ
jgi:tetratricopeptide (TPR) repeat protein